MIRYGLNHWDGLVRFLDEERIEIDSNTVERSIRGIALNRKNALFAGHNQGAEGWAMIASLLETCKLNAVDPLAWLTDVLTKLVKPVAGIPHRRADALGPRRQAHLSRAQGGVAGPLTPSAQSKKLQFSQKSKRELIGSFSGLRRPNPGHYYAARTGHRLRYAPARNSIGACFRPNRAPATIYVGLVGGPVRGVTRPPVRYIITNTTPRPAASPRWPALP